MGGGFILAGVLWFMLVPGLPCQTQGSGHNLEYVMQVLKQRGLLQKIDPSLLTRVQNVVEKQRQNKQSPVLPDLGHSLVKTSGLANLDVLGKSQLSVSKNPKSIGNNARTHLFQTKERERKFGGRVSNECDKYKRENTLLKQLLALQSQESQTDTDITDRIDKFVQFKQNLKNIPLQKLQDHSRSSIISNPLSHLQSHKLQEPISESEKLLDKIEDKFSYKSVLVTPTPTISTIFQTTSYEATVSINYTREIPLLIRGQRVMTTIIDPTTTVVTTTKTLSSTSTVIFSPTWKIITITPTLKPTIKIQKPKISNLGIHGLKNQVKPFGGFKAQVVEIPRSPESFKSIQQILRKLQLNQGIKPLLAAVSERTSHKLPETTTSVPSITTKILTLYLSGSKPGEYSTRLTTLFVDQTGEQIQRRKREINPTGVLKIETTKNVQMVDYIGDSSWEHIDDEIGEIQSSIFDQRQIQEVTNTVTVTVTVTSINSQCTQDIQIH